MKQSTVLEKALNWILNYFFAISLISVMVGYGYYKLSIEPKIDEKLTPIRMKVIETNLILQEMAPVEVREKVRRQMRYYEELDN